MIRKWCDYFKDVHPDTKQSKYSICTVNPSKESKYLEENQETHFHCDHQAQLHNSLL